MLLLLPLSLLPAHRHSQKLVLLVPGRRLRGLEHPHQLPLPPLQLPLHLPQPLYLPLILDNLPLGGLPLLLLPHLPILPDPFLTLLLPHRHLIPNRLIESQKGLFGLPYGLVISIAFLPQFLEVCLSLSPDRLFELAHELYVLGAVELVFLAVQGQFLEFLLAEALQLG